MEEDIEILEEHIEFLKRNDVEDIFGDMTGEILAIENLLTRYKEYDNLLGEIDSKEASDALYMLWHCALINKEFETQKQQFQIVNAYIKQLEEENKNMTEEYLVNNPGMAKYLNDNYIFKSKVKEKIEELENKIRAKQEIHQKLCKEIDKTGTETEYDYAMEELSILDDELREMLIEKRVLKNLLREEEGRCQHI